MHSNDFLNLLPVGALTAGGGLVPHSFRPWEVQSIDSIDLMDSCLGSVRFQVRGGDIMRVLPIVNDDVNGEWATDKGRYAPLDGLKVQEVRNSLLNVGDGKMQVVSMQSAIEHLTKSKGSIRVVYGATTDCESIESISKWCSLNNAVLETLSPVNKHPDVIDHFISGTNQLDCFVPEHSSLQLGLLVGCDPRRQSPLLNLQLRQRYLQGTEFFSIGSCIDLTYPVQHCGLGVSAFRRFSLSQIKFDFVLIGADLYRRHDIQMILQCLNSITDTKVRVCTTRANESFVMNHSGTNGLDVFSKFDLQILVNITEDEADAAGFDIHQLISSSKTNLVLAHKGSDWFKEADVVIPITNPLENASTYFSMLGPVRHSNRILNRPDSVSTISDLFDNSMQLYHDNTLVRQQAVHDPRITSKEIGVRSLSSPFSVSIVDYHLEGHVFAESSPTMARCSYVFTINRTNFC